MKGTKSARKVRILLISLGIFAAVILVASLLIQVKLTEAADENAKLRQNLDEITEENTRLTARFENSIDLAELEEYAKTVLGMQMPGSERIIQIDVPVQDKAVILSNTVKTDADKLVGSIMEYFSEVKCRFN